jgi:hypothetical protein
MARYSYSHYYGSPSIANQYPQYTTAELEETLQSPRLDAPTRAAIEAEIARRAVAKASKRRASR